MGKPENESIQFHTSAVARMSDKSNSTINRYVNGGLKGVKKMELKTAEIQTPIGLRSVTLLNENQILQVITKYKPELLGIIHVIFT